jgi:hypothetical protein
VTRVRPGQPVRIELQAGDSQYRRGLALVHELIHRESLPAVTDHEPLHSELHALAQVCVDKVFPGLETVMADEDPKGHFQTESTMEPELVLTDLETTGRRDRLARILGQRGRQRFAPTADGKVIRRDVDAGIAAEVTKAQFGGWMLPYLQQMFEARSYIIPIRGVYRCTPTFDIFGYRDQSWGTFWDSLIATLNGGTLSKTAKGFNSTVTTAGAVTLAFSVAVRSLGILVRFSDSLQAGENRPLVVTHFQAGGTAMQYIIGVNSPVAEWFVLHVNNDRGGGVPNAREDANIQVAAGASRTGSVWTVESVNMRELQA